MPNTTWLVQLYIDGPIAVQDVIRFQHPKGFGRTRPFYSDIRVSGISSGLRMSVTAYAGDSDLARKAALVFVGEMLDVLLPLRLSLHDGKGMDREGHSVKRIVTKEDLTKAFSRARWFSEHEPTFLRALGWFRKGLISEDPLDRFLALCNALENVAGKYHPVVPAAKKGSKSQLWECFKDIWGQCPIGPLLEGTEPG